MWSPRARNHQVQREALADATARAVLAEWSKVNPERVAAEWGSLLPKVTAMVQRGQLHAAQGTHTFMRDLLGKDAENAPQVVPEQFASQAPDGRNLMGLLARAIPTTIRSIAAGVSPRAAMARGAAFLDLTTRTVVADTGRQADQAAMVANKNVISYVRVVELPACSRCIILANKEYSVSAGFLRHPRCDCTMEPRTKKHNPTPLDAKALFDSMTPEQQRKVFGEAGAKAIRDNASIYTVVNARKSMGVVEQHGQKVKITYTGTGSRRVKRPPRLMPEEIYKIAESDNPDDPKKQRDHATRLLYKHGYLR